jgi:hypothetical protein
MSKGKQLSTTKSYGLDYISIDPHGDIGRAIKAENWLAGFSFAVTYLEHFGMIKIKIIVDSRIVQKKVSLSQKREVKKQFSEDVERMTATNILFLLFAFGLVDVSFYLDFRNIIAERNRLVHPSRKGMGFQCVEEEKKKRVTMLQNAQRLIEELEHVKV